MSAAPPAPSDIFSPHALDGQVALVTGGGTGLGLASAIELARCGAAVMIAGRREEVLVQGVDGIAAAAGPDARVAHVAGDIREASGAQRIVDGVLSHFGRLDTLVNNAGGQYFVPAEAITAKGWQAVWRLNVNGTVQMATAAVERALGPAGGGMIVNVTLSPHHGMPGMTHSGSARAAVEALTRELADCWRAQGVAVTAVAAGHFETDALQKYPKSVRAGVAHAVPIGRLGRAQEHAWLVALLATPLGRALNGSVITLDGARDNWFGPWPPTGLVDEKGHVPTETRRPPASG